MRTFTGTARDIVICLTLIVGIVCLWKIPEVHKKTLRLAGESQYGTKANLSEVETGIFLRHIETRLPKYRAEFQKAAQRYGIPWTLLASQAYQESRWNRNAMSPTGVRGLMMLTRVTASELGIQNRLDPAKSITGGARYFAQLRRQVSPSVQNSDRTWIALAAYNVGFGHIKDASRLARRMNKNPNRWDDLKTVLPYLAQKKYYKTLPHGYARGAEPVQYVQRIQAYWHILDQYLQNQYL